MNKLQSSVEYSIADLEKVLNDVRGMEAKPNTKTEVIGINALDLLIMMFGVTKENL